MKIDVKYSSDKSNRKFWVERKYASARPILDAINDLPENGWLELSEFDDSLPAYRIRQVIYAGNVYLHSTGVQIHTRLFGHNGDLRLLIGKEKI